MVGEQADPANEIGQYFVHGVVARAQAAHARQVVEQGGVFTDGIPVGAGIVSMPSAANSARARSMSKL